MNIFYDTTWFDDTEIDDDNHDTTQFIYFDKYVSSSSVFLVIDSHHLIECNQDAIIKKNRRSFSMIVSCSLLSVIVKWKRISID